MGVPGPVLVTNTFSSWVSMLLLLFCTRMAMPPSVTKCARRVNLTRRALGADARHTPYHTQATLTSPACARPCAPSPQGESCAPGHHCAAPGGAPSPGLLTDAGPE